jgi:hypothetical protein
VRERRGRGEQVAMVEIADSCYVSGESSGRMLAMDDLKCSD